jgi:hypothetical protein
MWSNERRRDLHVSARLARDEARLKVSRARVLELLMSNPLLMREWRRNPRHRSLTH